MYTETDLMDSFIPAPDMTEEEMAEIGEACERARREWEEAMKAELDEEEARIAEYHKEHPNDPYCIGEENYPWYNMELPF